MTTHIWLVRHGEPVREAVQRCYGSLDLPLSPVGREQAARVGALLRPEGIECVYTSPLRRTAETAEAIAAASGCPSQPVDALREIHFGDFEGLTYDEIAARYPDLYSLWMRQPERIQFPNGESLGAMRERVLAAFDSILRSAAGRRVAIVSHGGAIRIVLAHVLQIPDGNFFRIGQRHAAVNLITFTEGIPVVELLNAEAR